MTLRKLLSVLRQHGGEMTFADLRKANSRYYGAALVAVERKLARWTVYEDGTGGMALVESKGER